MMWAWAIMLSGRHQPWALPHWVPNDTPLMLTTQPCHHCHRYTDKDRQLTTQHLCSQHLCSQHLCSRHRPNDVGRGWARASWEEKQTIIREHIYFELGMFYFLANDPKVRPATSPGP